MGIRIVLSGEKGTGGGASTEAATESREGRPSPPAVPVGVAPLEAITPSAGVTGRLVNWCRGKNRGVLILLTRRLSQVGQGLYYGCRLPDWLAKSNDAVGDDGASLLAKLAFQRL